MAVMPCGAQVHKLPTTGPAQTWIAGVAMILGMLPAVSRLDGNRQ